MAAARGTGAHRFHRTRQTSAATSQHPKHEETSMPDAYAELRHELAVANRVLANEGIIDAFGHISARNPKDPNRYFISRHRASELVEPSDILEMTLDSKPA